MPTKAQILGVLDKEEAPVGREKLATILGEPTYRNFQTQLDRFELQGLVTHNEADGKREYWITELGKIALTEPELGRFAPSPGRMYITITESDLTNLSENEFGVVWKAIGVIVRKRNKTLGNTV